MSITGLIGGGLASVLSGGTLGVIGAVGSGVLDFFKTKEANKQERAVLAAQKDLAITTANSATLLETIKLMSASYDQDKAAYIGAGWQDSVRAMIRPMLIGILTMTSVYLALWSVARVQLETAVISEIAKYSVFTCLDLTAMGISWYFGSRQMEKINRNLAIAKKGK
jgi:hypothetical protein